MQDTDQLARCIAHADTWADRLSLGEPDRVNLRRACIIAGVVGLHADHTRGPTTAVVSLAEALMTTRPIRVVG